jgi:hypothetical protein
VISVSPWRSLAAKSSFLCGTAPQHQQEAGFQFEKAPRQWCEFTALVKGPKEEILAERAADLWI